MPLLQYFRPMCALMLATLILVSRGAAAAELVPFDSERWNISGEETRIEEYNGRQSLYLRRGQAVLGDIVFGDGIIEFDIAVENAQGFSGAIWRIKDARNYEEFYIRPHMSGNPDANQYTPVFNGLAGWQLYHGPAYGAPVTYRYGEWMHVKIVVSGTAAEVYIDSETPVLFIPELKHGLISGAIGLNSNFAPARFANFSYEAVDSPELKGSAPEPAPAPAGVVKAWKVSAAVDENTFSGQTMLAQAATDGLEWAVLEAEPTGIANLARVQGISDDRRATLAAITITSETPGIRAFRFGYSDRARVYLNRRLIYEGGRLYRSRDYRYLGTIGLFDTLYLPLIEGANDLVIMVGESFGGWGLIGQFPDSEGLTIEP